MSRWRHWCVAALLVAVTACHAPAQELGGRYTLAGEMAAGTPYQGAINLAPRGLAFDVAWDRAAGLPRRGFALRLDNVLGVAAEDEDEDFGVVLYHVKGGHLDGIWQGNLDRHVASLGHETLDGPDSLDGRYVISLGINPDGSNYSGLVYIHKGGPIYSVLWYTQALRYQGTGVLVGDVFVVGYSQSKQSGVAVYCLRSTKVVEGITALITDGRAGAEQFWPADTPAPPPDRLAAMRDRDHPFACGAPIAEHPLSPPAAVNTAALR